MNPLFIGPHEKQALSELRSLANARPVDIRTLAERLESPDGKAAHKQRMTEQSVLIPASYMVTFSIETGHPAGTARHMSMSVNHEEHVPNPVSLWMVAELLGFVGGLETCICWPEELQGHGLAVNVVQMLIHESRHE
jgi:hypothetical protein